MNSMATLCGNKISLRGLEPEDLDRLYIWENDATLWPYGSTRAPMTRHQLWQYIDNYDGDIFGQRQLKMMIVENETSRPAGILDIYEFDPRDGHAFVGIFVDEPYRRRKYAAEALALAADYCREVVGMHQIAARVCVDNSPSLALFKNAGFKSRACLRSWIKQGQGYRDVLIFQKLFE